MHRALNTVINSARQLTCLSAILQCTYQVTHHWRPKIHGGRANLPGTELLLPFLSLLYTDYLQWWPGMWVGLNRRSADGGLASTSKSSSVRDAVIDHRCSSIRSRTFVLYNHHDINCLGLAKCMREWPWLENLATSPHVSVVANGHHVMHWWSRKEMKCLVVTVGGTKSWCQV